MSGVERTKMILSSPYLLKQSLGMRLFVKATLQPLQCGSAKSNTTRCCYGSSRPEQRWWLVYISPVKIHGCALCYIQQDVCCMSPPLAAAKPRCCYTCTCTHVLHFMAQLSPHLFWDYSAPHKQDYSAPHILYKQVNKTFYKNVQGCRDGSAKNHSN